MISKNINLIRENISLICNKYQLKHKIQIMGVSKGVESNKIEEAIKNGIKIFGENKIIEAKNKWGELKEKHRDVELHFIGHLQSNKVKDALQIFDVIQTLDREKIIAEFAKHIKLTRKYPKFFIQVNVGNEKQKSGVSLKDVDNLIKISKEKYSIQIDGLMCIPPINDSSAEYFALLANIAKRNNIKNLSMGMSSDYQDAIIMQSNLIRLGKAIFVPRKSKPIA